VPTYVVLYRFTDQGLKNIKDTVRRAREVRAENEKRGFKVVVSIVEAPSEDAMLAGLFNIAATGNVHSETLHAHTEAEMERALQGS